MKKRVFDCVFAGAGLLAYLPIWILIALAILIETRKNFVFTQTRLGRNFRVFQIYKFCSMDDHQNVTRTGKWVRATGLDESLQFLNVLKGEMSLVGPRPITNEDRIKLDWNQKKYKWRWQVNPGITGLAQMMEPLANHMSLVKDRLTIWKGGFWFDLKMLIMTFFFNIFGKKRARIIFVY